MAGRRAVARRFRALSDVRGAQGARRRGRAICRTSRAGVRRSPRDLRWRRRWRLPRGRLRTFCDSRSSRYSPKSPDRREPGAQCSASAGEVVRPYHDEIDDAVVEIRRQRGDAVDPDRLAARVELGRGRSLSDIDETPAVAGACCLVAFHERLVRQHVDKAWLQHRDSRDEYDHDEHTGDEHRSRSRAAADGRRPPADARGRRRAAPAPASRAARRWRGCCPTR